MYYVSPESNPYFKDNAFVTIDAALAYAEVVSRLTKYGIVNPFEVWETHPKTHDRVVRAVATDGVARWQMPCPTCDGPPKDYSAEPHWKCGGKGYVEDPRGSR